MAMKVKYKIIVIDDDESILRLIKNTLERSGFEVTALLGIDSIDICTFVGFDLILLDIMMPLDGLEICKTIRNKVDVPIIFITAKHLETEVLDGIKVGADDYIKKPFSIVELVARVKMHLRREERNKLNSRLLIFGDLLIDEDAQNLSIKNEVVPLTKREFILLHTLASNPHRIFSVEELYERIYPSESDTQFRSIAEYIYQIRSKLRPFSINPIKTQWGGGYCWSVD